MRKDNSKQELEIVPPQELEFVPLLGGKRDPKVVQKLALWWYSF